MRKVLLYALFTLIYSYNCSAQFYSGAVSYLPMPATTNDSIFVYDTLTTKAGIILSRYVSYSVHNDSIYIDETFINDCNDIGDAEIYRVTNIGKLPKGIYNVLVKASYRNFICNSGDTFLNHLSFKLIIEDTPSSIEENLNFVTSFYPTTFHNTLQLKALNPKSKLYVYDLNGRCVYSLFSLNSSLNINTSDWQSGFYIVSVESNGERKRWKVLKE